SYFALKLPHNVWLWAIDTALEDDIDPPQVDFFERHAALIKPHERLILVVPNPAWLHCVNSKARDESDYDPSWRKLRKIISIVTDRETLSSENIPLIIAGDWHHYAHYKETGNKHVGRHLITCGLGGAYMLGTTRLPATLHCENGRVASLQDPTFPTVEESRNQRWGVLKFALRYKFSNVLIAIGLLLTVWFMRSAPHYFEPCTGGVLAKLSAVLRAFEWPPSALAILISIMVFLGFAKPRDDHGQTAWKWVTAGLLHALAQLCVTHWIVELTFCFVRSGGLKGLAVTLFALPASFVFCVLATGMLFPLYLMAANKIFGLHDEELYSSQAIERYKGFMRIKITRKEICVYPIGLTEICESWAPAYAPAAPAAQIPILEGLRGAAMRQLEKASNMLPEAIRVRSTQVEMANDTSHLFNPQKRLAAHLIDGPISIPLPGGAQKPEAQS
ncbi:MAG: hypothetical protein N2444_04295, partial [Methylocystis sp.]|nr:hypothetical protein [Methylocystis sp.]